MQVENNLLENEMNEAEINNNPMSENNLSQETSQRETRQSSHSHHRHHSSGSRSVTNQHHRQKSSFETIVAKHLLKIIGILFFLAGLLWLGSMSDTLPFISKLTTNFFTVVEDEEYVIATSKAASTSGVGFIYLIPGILILLFAYLNKLVLKGKTWLSLTSFYVGAGLLYFAHLAEYFYGLFIIVSLPYQSFPIAVAVTLGLAASVMYFTSILQKWQFHIISIAFVYATVILMAIAYGSANHLLFVLIFVFSFLLYLFSGKVSGNTVNTFNAYGALAYIGLFFLRKLFLKLNPDAVWFYVGYATALYVMILVIQIVKPYKGANLVKRYFSYSIIFATTAYYFVTVWFVFYKYDMYSLQWIFAALLTCLNIGLLRLNRTVNPENSHAPFYYAAIFVAAAIVPLAVQVGQLLVYLSMAALFFIVFAKHRHHQFAAIIAVGMLSIAMVMQLVKTVLFYFPAVYFQSEYLPFQPFMVCLITGGAVSIAAFTLNRYFVTIGFNYSQKWFSRTNTGQYIKTLFYASLYMTVFWLFQYLFFSFFNVSEAHLISWYAFHITFLLLLQLFVLERKSWVFKPMLIISIASIMAMPVVINFFAIGLREIALNRGGSATSSFYFHFLTIIPLTALVLVTTSNIKLVYTRFKEHAAVMLLFRIGFFVYLFLAEYDHLTVILNASQHTEHAMIHSNRLLPYTVVFYLTSLVLVLFSFVRDIKLLRQLSLMILFFTTLKVFILDFSSFSPLGKVVSFWLSGGLLLLYSFIYQQLRKFDFDHPTDETHKHSSQHYRQSKAVGENRDNV